VFSTSIKNTLSIKVSTIVFLNFLTSIYLNLFRFIKSEVYTVFGASIILFVVIYLLMFKFRTFFRPLVIFLSLSILILDYISTYFVFRQLPTPVSDLHTMELSAAVARFFLTPSIPERAAIFIVSFLNLYSIFASLAFFSSQNKEIASIFKDKIEVDFSYPFYFFKRLGYAFEYIFGKKVSDETQNDIVFSIQLFWLGRYVLAVYPFIIINNLLVVWFQNSVILTKWTFASAIIFNILVISVLLFSDILAFHVVKKNYVSYILEKLYQTGTTSLAL
jgi:hypothetical protein